VQHEADRIAVAQQAIDEAVELLQRGLDALPDLRLSSLPGSSRRDWRSKFPLREALSWQVTQLSSRNVRRRFVGRASAGPTKNEATATVATRINLRIGFRPGPPGGVARAGRPAERVPLDVEKILALGNPNSPSNTVTSVLCRPLTDAIRQER
jgi:hypothetical protein